MEIIVEIGTTTQKDQITEELSIIPQIIEPFNISVKLLALIVPNDFDKTINELEQTKNYKSLRSHIALGKAVYTPKGDFLVFSPLLYTNNHDSSTRYIIYFHEMWHIINHYVLPKPIGNSVATTTLTNFIYKFYDEYYVNRKALWTVDAIMKSKSHIFLKHISSAVVGHYIALRDSKDYQNNLQLEIDRFRLHGDVPFLMEKINRYIDKFGKDLVYLASYIDHYKQYTILFKNIKDTSFLRIPAIDLIDFYRIKYEEDSIDLLDGINLMENYLFLYGIHFEDVEEGLYCHVFDIT